jgi:hypothetical protein
MRPSRSELARDWVFQAPSLSTDPAPSRASSLLQFLRLFGHVLVTAPSRASSLLQFLRLFGHVLVTAPSRASSLLQFMRLFGHVLVAELPPDTTTIQALKCNPVGASLLAIGFIRRHPYRPIRRYREQARSYSSCGYSDMPWSRRYLGLRDDTRPEMHPCVYSDMPWSRSCPRVRRRYKR